MREMEEKQKKMENSMALVSSMDALRIRTLTNEPHVELPADYIKEIKKEAYAFIRSYALFDISTDIAGDISVFTRPVENRLANMVAHQLAIDVKCEPSKVHDFALKNCSLSFTEERAIIEAYRNHVPDAIIYVRIFFAYKVSCYMAKYGLFARRDAKEVFSRLMDEAMLKIIDDFDFAKIKHGGIAKKYAEQRLYDFYRSEILANERPLKTGVRKESEFAKIKRIGGEDIVDYGEHIRTRDEDAKLPIGELARKYKVGKKSIVAYQELVNAPSLSSFADEEGTPFEVAAKEDKNYKVAELKILATQYYANLEAKFGVSQDVAIKILRGAAASKSINGRAGFSQRKRANFAMENDIPKKIINLVLGEFAETFRDAI